MATVIADPAIAEFAEELYQKLVEHIGNARAKKYVAEHWLDELLKPLGYQLTDQCRVFIALRYLRGQNRIRFETANVDRHRPFRLQKPQGARIREITILK